MDVVFLSRLQFAAATMFHFLFVPLTLGLSFIIAIMETIYVRTGDEEYKRMTKFWGKIFIINFVVGVVTGLTLEFQFGTNWAGYSKYVGDIFGSLLAIEATTSFFLESTFIGVWIFGWNRISPRLHCASIWLVAIASSASAYWILVANTFMQSPVGYVLRDGRAELTDLWAVLSQPYAVFTFLHTVWTGYLLAGFFVMGVSAYHLLRKAHVDFFTKSFRIGLVFALIFSIGVVVIGDFLGKVMGRVQPLKLAGVEAVWETQRGVPFHLLVIPDETNERNSVELFGIPKLMSWIVFGDWNAEIRGLKTWPKEDRPPVSLIFWSFRLMVGLGFLFVLVSILAWWKRNTLESSPVLLRTCMYMIPLPYLAAELGWLVKEVGRQPWLVYQVMRTTEGHSAAIVASQVAISLTGFIVVYSILGLVAYALMVKTIKEGPAAA